MWQEHKKKYPEVKVPEEFVAGSELVLNANEELVPMNRMHGENTVSNHIASVVHVKYVWM